MTNVWPILVFGLFALLLVTYLQRERVMKENALSPRLLVLFGLILISTLGVALASSAVTDSSKTAAFTLLGTIAGYLVSIRSSRADDASSRSRKGERQVTGDQDNAGRERRGNTERA
jgi:FtsH-binding integral membrane protein